MTGYLQQLVERAEGGAVQNALKPRVRHRWARDPLEQSDWSLASEIETPRDSIAITDRQMQGTDFAPVEKTLIHSKEPLKTDQVAISSEYGAQKSSISDPIFMSDRPILSEYGQMQSPQVPRRGQAQPAHSNPLASQNPDALQPPKDSRQQQPELTKSPVKYQITSNKQTQAPKRQKDLIPHPSIQVPVSPSEKRQSEKLGIKAEKLQVVQQISPNTNAKLNKLTDSSEGGAPASDRLLKPEPQHPHWDRSQKPKHTLSLQPHVEDLWHRKPSVRRNPKQPRLVIGRLTVEVINAPSDPKPKVSEPVLRGPQSSQPNRPTRPPSKLRFGLGQM